MTTTQIPGTMKAIRLHSYGGPELLQYEEITIPTPRPGEVLIRVRAAAVNPLDSKIREGYVQQFMPITFPYTPGSDFAGIVEEISDGVTTVSVSQEVYGVVEATHGGAYAEYLAAPAATLAPKPLSLDFPKAASVPVVSMTAWQALFDVAGLSEGQSILIHGAAGGVGMFAVQFAHWKGAHVIATASGVNADFVRELGADEVIEYNTERFEERTSKVDVVLDLIGGETQQRSWQVLKPGGLLAATSAPPSQDEASKHGVRAAMVQMHGSGALLASIAALVDAGQVKTFVGATFPLDQAAKAQLANQSGHVRGKIVIEIG